MSRSNQAQHIVVLDNVTQDDLSRALRRSGLVVSPGCFHNVLVISKAPLRFPDEPNVIDLAAEVHAPALLRRREPEGVA